MAVCDLELRRTHATNMLPAVAFQYIQNGEEIVKVHYSRILHSALCSHYSG